MTTAKELSDLSNSIADLDMKIHGINREQNKLNNRLIVIRAQYVLDIGLSKDDKGKATYRNEELRNAAITLKIAENDEFQRLLEQGRELSAKSDEYSTERNKLVERRRFGMMELSTNSQTPDDDKQLAMFYPARTKQEIDKLHTVLNSVLDSLSSRDQPQNINDDVDVKYLNNASDVLNWVLGGMTTEEFLSDEHMNLGRLQRIAAHEAQSSDLPIPLLKRSDWLANHT